MLFNDHLLVHILELAKFTKTAAELVTPLDRWLYFLRNGENLDPAALPPQLEVPEIRRASEVLANMNQSTIERERYEARQKYLHDVATWQEALAQSRESLAQMAKIQEGLEQAQGKLEQAAKDIKAGLLHRIHFCEQLLGRTPAADEQLSSLPVPELEQLAAKLETEVTRSISATS